MRPIFCAFALVLALTSPSPAEELTSEIGWNKSFLNGRRDAANLNQPMVVLFYDRVQLDYYDDVLAKDDKVRAAAKGFVFIKVEREGEKDLTRKMGVKSPWEVRILAPDLTVLKAFTSKVKAADLAAALKGLQKTWSAPNPKRIDWVYSFDEAARLCAEQNRPMMIYFWSEEKKGAHPDENPLLKNDRVVQMSRKFVCLKLNQAIDQALFDKFKVSEIPYLLFLKPNGEWLQGPDELIKLEVLVAFMKDILAQFDPETVESGAKEKGGAGGNGGKEGAKPDGENGGTKQ